MGLVSDPRDFPAVSAALRTLVHRGVNGGYYFNNQGQGAMPYLDEPPSVWGGPGQPPDFVKDPSLGQALLYFVIEQQDHEILIPPPYTTV